MRPKGSSAILEQRRRDAIGMLRQGMKPAAVAKAVRASLVSVGRWRKAARSGPRALAARPTPGRPPKLGPADLQKLLTLLRQGPVFHGFATELWTLARVSVLIERHWGVKYHPGHVWRLLQSLGWSSQKPERRARERDEAAIERWRQTDWPRIKKCVPSGPKRAVPR